MQQLHLFIYFISQIARFVTAYVMPQNVDLAFAHSVLAAFCCVQDHTVSVVVPALSHLLQDRAVGEVMAVFQIERDQRPVAQLILQAWSSWLAS